MGLRIGKGETLQQIQDTMKAVAEGVLTARSAYMLSKKLGTQVKLFGININEVLYFLHPPCASNFLCCKICPLANVLCSQNQFSCLCWRKIDMQTPIIDGIYHVLYEGSNPAETVVEVMSRELRPEVDDEIHQAAAKVRHS